MTNLAPFIFFLLSSFIYSDPGEEIIPEAIAPQKDAEYRFMAVPVAGYVSDFGLGLGAVGAFYKQDPALKPYRYALDLSTYFMTSGQQSHALRFDYIDMAGLPLRARAKLGLFFNLNKNYCGQGTFADCAPEMPHNSNFYLIRYLEYYGTADAQWHLKTKPYKLDVIASWRGSFYQERGWNSIGPYPGSLYQKDFGDQSANGFASVFEAGLILDNRDNEPAPTEGYWIEATAREASPFWGSTWRYFGANLSLRGYLPFDSAKRWVLAAQIILDGLVGKAPLQEIVRVGGTMRVSHVFGGQDIGRGLREEYFPGRLKAFKQLELRYHFADFTVFKQHFAATTALFGDIGTTAWNWDTLDKEPFKLALGFGTGFRFTWNEAFVVRFDIGVSPIEGYTPKFYVVVGNVF